MSRQLYKIFFIFYTVFGTLSLKFHKNRFIVSKLLVIKEFLVLIFTIILFFALENPNKIATNGLPDFQKTEFTKRLFDSAYVVPFTLIFIFSIVQLRANKHIAKMLNILIKLEVFLVNENVDLTKLRKQLLKFFVGFFSFLSLNFLSQATLIMKNLTFFEIIPLMIAILSMSSFLSAFAFVNANLIFLKFLLNFYRIILENEFLKFHHDHQKINLFLINLNTVFHFLKLFNKSVSKLATLCIIIFIISFIYFVSINFFKSHN